MKEKEFKSLTKDNTVGKSGKVTKDIYYEDVREKYEEYKKEGFVRVPKDAEGTITGLGKNYLSVTFLPGSVLPIPITLNMAYTFFKINPGQK